MSREKSTIVRPTPRPAPYPVRAGFGGLDRWAPDVAARIVEHLWFRLPAAPTTERRARRQPPGGHPFAINKDGVRVVGRIFGPDDAPTAVLVHGWGGWWQQLGAHVHPLLDAGYRVVAYDAPSHGDSPVGRHGSRSSTVLEIAGAYAAVLWQQGPADLVLAHSLGAMAAVWAHDRGSVAGAYAFLAPMASVAPTVDGFHQVLGMGRRTRQLLVQRVESRIGHRFADFDVEAIGCRLGTAGASPPLLCIHDLGDTETPAQGSVAITTAWPGGGLLLTEGLGHRRLLWDDHVVRQVAEFARAHRPSARTAPAVL
ncbi:alpha/beta fold hydrolase [soil metagenome]